MSFDYKKELENYPAPNHWKAGVLYYIEHNKLAIKSKKEFGKIIDDFNKIKLGE